ncbi:MAG TPA: hypothetical protein VK731_06140 [Candidatus Cybelea sp.]|jgi:hypothetical protein|nr:hypothetical protein [Candidatus Cybelea sp.]
MDTPPFISDEQRRKDKDQINLLSVFHFVLSGLLLLGIGFLCLHYFMMHYFFSHPEMWKGKDNFGPPKELFQAFIWFYFVAGFLLAVACVANILSGIFLLQKKFRMFSLVVAGLDCLQIPFGTALGVFTFIVLLRDSVRQSYPV